MIKELIGTILGRKKAMYQFIYYHTFKRFILTYLLFAFLLSLIKLIDVATASKYIPGINLFLFYTISIFSILRTVILIGLLLSAVAIIVFVLAKLFKKQVNFGQLFLAMHSIAPFFIVVKLMYSLGAFFGSIVIVSIIFHWLALASILYFIIIAAKTASYFTTFNFIQALLIMLFILAGILGIIYGIYLQIMASLPAELTNSTLNNLPESIQEPI
tara:strand:- start:765 stop:1409 length:645 start_codon:yes stop_codon:yes gene_type:complete